MNIRLCIAALSAVLLSACTNQVTGQKGRGGALATNLDSVSYGIGTDIGHNIKQNMEQAGLDSLNLEALFGGLRDGFDSTERIASEKVRTLVQTYMIEAQKKQMALREAEGQANLKAGEAFLTENGKRPGVVTTATGLQYEVLQAGTGPKPTMEDNVKVNFRGTLIDGKEFESSYRSGQPFVTGLTGVIAGWTEGLQLMPVGSRYKLYIPSSLAWGAQAAGPDIPAYSTVIFEMELLEIVK
ncbi:MAG TPA: FKBP-type peptidyl-prolyl cis-trans isomerase [Flavobacteriales bacterium]